MMLFSCAAITPTSAALQVVMGLLSCTQRYNLYADAPSLPRSGRFIAVSL